MIKPFSTLLSLDIREWESKHDGEVEDSRNIQNDSNLLHHAILHFIQLLRVISKPESLVLRMNEGLPYPDREDDLLPDR